jgi:hypothetical protein
MDMRLDAVVQVVEAGLVSQAAQVWQQPSVADIHRIESRVREAERRALDGFRA